MGRAGINLALLSRATVKPGYNSDSKGSDLEQQTQTGSSRGAWSCKPGRSRVSIRRQPLQTLLAKETWPGSVCGCHVSWKVRQNREPQRERGRAANSWCEHPTELWRTSASGLGKVDAEPPSEDSVEQGKHGSGMELSKVNCLLNLNKQTNRNVTESTTSHTWHSVSTIEPTSPRQPFPNPWSRYCGVPKTSRPFSKQD